MRHVPALFAALAVLSVALASPAAPTAITQADDTTPLQTPPAPSPAPSPAPTSAPPNCAACMQCVGTCGAAYATCTGKCVSLPDIAAQQACIAACPSIAACAQACPCAGCANVPGLPH